MKDSQLDAVEASRKFRELATTSVLGPTIEHEKYDVALIVDLTPDSGARQGQEGMQGWEVQGRVSAAIDNRDMLDSLKSQDQALAMKFSEIREWNI